MALSSSAIKTLIGEASSMQDLIGIVDQLISFGSNYENDLITVRSQCNTIERTKQKHGISQQDYLIKLAQLTESLLFYIDRITIAHAPGARNAKTKVLYVSALPQEADSLQIDFEYKKVKKEMDGAASSCELLSPVLAATVTDLMTELARTQPNVLHFAGHAGQRGILMTTDENTREVIPPDALTALIKNSSNPSCVFLNACYSSLHATTIGTAVKYVIAMNSPVIDDTAVIFSQAFYAALSATQPPEFEKSFHLAKTLLSVRKPDEEHVPELWTEGKKVA